MEKNLKEEIAKYTFLMCALTSILCFITITVFIFSNGISAISQIGFFNFIFGNIWSPREKLFGIFPMIVTSILVTMLSFFFSCFIGKWAAIFLAYFCPKKFYGILKSVVELLAGIPSVIYGFFGVIVIVPLVRETFGGAGKSMLSAIIILTIMVLPTIINISESAIQSVPRNYYEGAISLGTTHSEAVFKIVVPAAKSGIVASYILGVGRALGETMAVILVAGNSPTIPKGLLKPVRTLTSGVAMEINYATGLHQQALFGIGVVLFIFILILNISLNLIAKREV
jgi:phosphate transport system permease protein